MKLIPFKWLPASWGLKGKSYDRAEVEYLYTGEVLERNLADIDFEQGSDEQRKAIIDIDYRYGHISDYERDERTLRIDFANDDELEFKIIDLKSKHGLLDDYNHDVEIAALIGDDAKRKIALLENDIAYGRIDQYNGELEIANIKGERYVGGPMGLDDNGEFRVELVWNNLWIENLRKEGYDGASEDIVMKKWFAEICYNEVVSTNPDGVDPIIFNTAREALRNSFKE